MIKSHVIRLYPTKTQEGLFIKSCGVARFSYNWALSKWKEMYEAGGRPTAYQLIKLQNSIKKEQFPFFYEISKTAPQYSIHNLQSAYINFYKGIAGYPRFKKKGRKDSFVAVENWQTYKQRDYKIHLPKIGWVKCAENQRFAGKVIKVTVKRVADYWFASINIENEESIRDNKPQACNNQAVVGIDLGIKTMLVLSDGTLYGNPHLLNKNIKKLKRLQRSLSRKQKGGTNRKKQQLKIARLHYKIACIRKHHIHNATSYIVSKYDILVIENLNIKGMIKNKNLSKSISDVSFYEIRRQLEYKAKWSNKKLIIADRWFASSKTCNNCRHKNDELKLSDRIFHCSHCGHIMDRDLNAAKNLADYGTTLKSRES